MRLRLVRTLAALGILCGLGAGLAGFSAGLAVVSEKSRDLPDHTVLAHYVPRTGSRILADDGVLISRKVEQRRTFVPIGRIPPLVVRAFLSAEDRNYYQHSGVDPLAIARAALGRFGGGQGGGGSTITQQVAKNLLVGNERSLDRKIREALLALRMDRDLGKDRVLEIYLNEIYLGLGAYGVAEAAQTYFGKPLEALAPAEAAVLAGMPKAPSAFNPRRNPVRAVERRNYVLRRMAEDGVIGEDEAAAGQRGPIVLAQPGSRESEGQAGSWFEDVAWRIAGETVGADVIGRQDVVVRTTLKPAYQAAAESALKAGVVRADRALGYRGPLGRVRLPVDWADPLLDPPAGAEDFTVGVVLSADADAEIALDATRRVRLGADGTRWAGGSPRSLLRPGDVVLLDLAGARPSLAQLPAVDGGLVAIDPRTGDVVALVGGFSREKSSFDRATQAKRQAGSSYKPILYSAALKLGYDATSPLLDAPIALEQGPGQVDWRPNDAKGAGHGGLITVRRALELSRNMATVRLLWDLGLDDMQAMAARLGVAPEKPLTYVAALGAVEVSPLQMALAYGTFADGGLKRRPRFVTEIRAASGAVLAAPPPDPGDPVLDPIAAGQMASILRGVVERGTARRAFAGFAGPLSGKTGTTNAARDAWFVGFSPEIVVAVWIGRDDNQALADDAGGGKVAAPVVRDFLEGARIRTTPFPIPTGAQTVSVDPETGVASSGRNAVAEIVREIPELPTARVRARAAGPAGAPARDRPAGAERPRRVATPAPPPFDPGPAEAIVDVQ